MGVAVGTTPGAVGTLAVGAALGVGEALGAGPGSKIDRPPVGDGVGTAAVGAPAGTGVAVAAGLELDEGAGVCDPALGVGEVCAVVTVWLIADAVGLTDDAGKLPIVASLPTGVILPPPEQAVPASNSAAPSKMFVARIWISRNELSNSRSSRAGDAQCNRT
jgi:hypothetical protein